MTLHTPAPLRRALGIALCAMSALLTLPAAQAQTQTPESLTGWLLSFEHMKEVRPVADPTYQAECGECHLAYQPGLLPARSWQALLTPEALRRHFGVSAEIDPARLATLRSYALAHAADRSYTKRSRKIAVATEAGPVPLRISALRPIERVHQALPSAWVTGNPGVKSLAQCDACHTQAAQGVYDNDMVDIPGHPR
jgi:hypothetical protein